MMKRVKDDKRGDEEEGQGYENISLYTSLAMR